MVHEDDPEMPRAGAGMTFTRLVECFIYGCLMPLVVSALSSLTPDFESQQTTNVHY